MKKFLIFVLLAAVAYFGYDRFFKEKNELEIKAYPTTSTSYSSDINAPSLSPTKYGKIEGTAKNLSEKVIANIQLKYKLNTEIVEAHIDKLEPGEEKNFSTQSIRLRNSEVTFYLEEKSYQ
jgi:hypothetical protein